MSLALCSNCGSVLGMVDGRCPLCPSETALRIAELERRERRTQLLQTAATIGCIFAFLDFLTPCLLGAVARLPAPPTTRPVFISFVAICVGGCLGQLGMLAGWAVLAPQGLLGRLVSSGLTTFLLALALFAGIAAHAGNGGSHELLAALFCAPLVFVAVQAPLWALRLVQGWRLAAVDEVAEDTQQRAGQFRIRDLFVAVGVVGLVFTLARVGFSIRSSRVGPSASDPEMWIPVLIACGVCLVSVLISTVPCTFAVLRSDRTGRASLLVAAGALAAALLVAAALVFVFLLPADAAFAVCLSVAAGLFGVQFACLYVVRNYGFRIVGR